MYEDGRATRSTACRPTCRLASPERPRPRARCRFPLHCGMENAGRSPGVSFSAILESCFSATQTLHCILAQNCDLGRQLFDARSVLLLEQTLVAPVAQSQVALKSESI